VKSAAAARVTAATPGARFVKVGDSPHLSPLEQPVLAEDHVRELLPAQQPGDAAPATSRR
jgi:hypothetical protein